MRGRTWEWPYSDRKSEEEIVLLCERAQSKWMDGSNWAFKQGTYLMALQALGRE